MPDAVLRSVIRSGAIAVRYYGTGCAPPIKTPSDVGAVPVHAERRRPLARALLALAVLTAGVLAAWWLASGGERGETELSEPRLLPLVQRDDLRAGPNVLILVLDAVRADFLGAYSRAWSGERSFTPALDRLAARGARFENAIASGTWTRPTVASIFTGLRPMRHADWFGLGGENFTRRDGDGRPLAHSLAAGFDTLAEVMRRAGYTTACFAPGEHGQYHRRSGFDQGFEFYEASYSDARFVRSDSTFRALTNWFGHECPGRRPFFTFVHTLGAHQPYLPPAPWDEMYRGAFERWAGEVSTAGENRSFLVDGETRRERYLELYAGLVSHADHHLGKLLDHLQEIGVLDNTLLVVTADHGHALWDHGRAGHGYQLFEETIRVPLIVAGPGIEPGVVSTQAELVDLFPTVLEFTDDESAARLDGRSLLALARGEPAQPPHPKAISFQTPDMVAVRAESRFKLIYSGPGSHGGEHLNRLFDLEADPAETEDVAALHPQVVLDLRHELQRSVLAQSAGWHLLFDPGDGDAEFSATVDFGSPPFDAFDYHCVPFRDRSLDDWLAGACPRAGGEVTARGQRLDLRAALRGEALHVHFRPMDPLATVTFDLRIDGEPAPADLVSLGTDDETPADSRFELGPRSAASVGLWADGEVTAEPGRRRGIRIWRVDFPPAVAEVLPEETAAGLRALGYVD